MAHRNKRQSIHNNFFQQVFSNPDNLTDFLQAILPAEVAELLDFSWIALDQQEYIQTDLGCNAADLVAHLPTKDGAGLDKRREGFSRSARKPETAADLKMSAAVSCPGLTTAPGCRCCTTNG